MCAWCYSFLPCLRTVPALREYPEMGSPQQSSPQRRPHEWGRKAGLGLCHPTNQSHDAPAPALSMESIAILVKPSLQASQTTFIWMENHAKQTDLDAHRQCRRTAVGSRKSTSLGAR